MSMWGIRPHLPQTEEELAAKKAEAEALLAAMPAFPAGEDCQAAHCPPGPDGRCDWPRCAVRAGRVRVVVTEDEKWPVYWLRPVDPAVLAEFPGAGIEVDRAFLEEIEAAGAAWDAVQARLGVLAGEINAAHPEGGLS